MQVAIDIETTGLDFLTDSVVAVGAVVSRPQQEKEFFLWEHMDVDAWNAMPEQLTRLFNEADEVLVHNAAFDLPRLNYHHGVPIPRNIWDTMIAERLLIAGLNATASLEDVVERRLDAHLDKEVQTTFKAGEWLTDRQRQYLHEDVLYLFDVQKQQDEDIQGDNLDYIWDIEYLVTSIFCQMIARGVRIDRDGLVKLIDEEREIVQNLTNQVSRRLTPYVMKSRIRKFDAENERLNTYLREAEAREEELWQDIALEFGNEEGPEVEKEIKKRVRQGMTAWRKYNKRPPKPKLDESPVNLGSPQQLMACFKELGWDLPTTGTDDMKTYLPRLEGEEKEILKTLIDYRKHSKMVTAFGDPLIQFLDEDNILHGQFQQYGTQTGRPTCKEPNLLQMPSTEEFRSKFIPREGYKFVVADYSQMELRLTAELTKDEAMMEAFINDLDLHKHTASLMYGTPYDLVTDKQRAIAKTINFMVLYGGGYNKLRTILASDGIYITESEAKKAMEQWHKTYSSASRGIARWGKSAIRFRFTETALGRKRRFEVSPRSTEWEKKGIERQGANHVIQGSNADITKLAMVLIHNLFMKERLDAAIVLQIYDEIVVEARADHAQRACDIVRAAMTSAAEDVLQTVPVKVSPSVEDSWVK